MENDSERLKIHFFYCTVILGLIIIAIATDRWTAQQKFTEYLSNAATMTSLVLGLVAIFYSFIANDGLSRSLGNINTVSENIKQTKDQISSYLQLTESATEATRGSTLQMQELSKKVDKDLTSLTSTLMVISEKSDALHNSLTALPDRLDKLESSVLDATKAVGEKIQLPTASTRPQMPATAVVERFLELAPLSGNLLCIACTLAVKFGKPLVLSEYTKTIDEKIDSYLSGFLACMDSAQYVSREIVPNQTRIYKIRSVHQVLETSSRTYFLDYINRVYKDKPETLELWAGKLTRVEALFDSPETDGAGA